MINKILPNNIINKNVSFNALSRQERNEINNIIYKDHEKQESRVLKNSALLGLLTGGICELAKVKNSLNKAIGVYFASYFILNAANGINNANKYRKEYSKYESEYDYKNGFDKLIGKIAVPKPLNLGNEEKNKEYYETYKNNQMRSIKQVIGSLMAVGLTGLAADIICKIKTIPDKDWIVGNVKFITLLVSLGAGFALQKAKDEK